MNTGHGGTSEEVPRRRRVRHWPGEIGPECGETEFRFPRDLAITTDQEVTCPRCRLILGLDTSQSGL